MVGWFDAVEKGNALRYGGFDQIVINKLDALTSIVLCPASSKFARPINFPMEPITRSVPRNESLRQPFNLFTNVIQGWTEDLCEGSSILRIFPNKRSNIYLPCFPVF
jgi:adenylosuccinate synthase